jgi:hypothetical protein
MKTLLLNGIYQELPEMQTDIGSYGNLVKYNATPNEITYSNEV